MYQDASDRKMISGIAKEFPDLKYEPSNISNFITIYDMLIRIEDELVPFVIIDLPGRYDILNFFMDPYILNIDNWRRYENWKPIDGIGYKKGTLYKEYNNNKHKHRAILSSMCVNPLYLAALDPILVAETLNKYPNILKHIVEYELDLELVKTCYNDENNCVIPGKYNMSSNKIIFTDEYVASDPSGDITIKNIIELKSGINITADKNAIKHIKFIKKWNNKFDSQNDAYIMVRLLNRMFAIPNSKNFDKIDILKKIYEAFIDKNNYEEFVAQAPLEAVYINEIVSSILRIIVTNPNILNMEYEEANKIINIQDSRNYNEVEQSVIDKINNLYDQKGDFVNYVLADIYDVNTKYYSSDKIYMYCKSDIEKIINHYFTNYKLIVEDDNAPRIPADVSAIKNIKLLYILNNTYINTFYKEHCHQIKLFDDTYKIAKLLDNSNIIEKKSDYVIVGIPKTS